MTAIELLPLGGPDGYASKSPLHWNDEAMTDYARANMAPLIAEIEALRAALESLKAHMGNAVMSRDGIIKALEKTRDEQGDEIHRLRAELETAKGQAEFYRTTRNKCQRKAERLAEALRFYADTNNWIGRFVTDPTTPAEEDGGDNARESLRDHDQEVGNG